MITTANGFYDGMVKERSRIPVVGQPPSDGPGDYMRQHEGSGYSLIQPIFIKNPPCASGKLCILTMYQCAKQKRMPVSWSLLKFSEVRSDIYLYIVCPMIIRTMKKNKASDRELLLEHWFEMLLSVIGWLGRPLWPDDI